MIRPYQRTLILVLTTLLAATLTACAAHHVETEYRGTGFTVKPRMSPIPDTDVYYIRDATDYDLYEFEGTWYLNDNSIWYSANSWRGPFEEIEVSVIPNEIATVPSDYRRNWVSVRRDRRDSRYRDLPEGYSASSRTFSRRPSMASIPGTRVTFARRAPDYDLYRYRGTWYLVDDGTWFRSSTWRGPFLTIDESSVPAEVLTIPSGYRREWSQD
jgi:hypothetical protein